VDPCGRLMMLPVFSSSLFVNRIPQAQSAAEGGRSSGGFFLGFVPKATAYKALGAAIERVPATSVPPENPVMKLFAVIAIYAATGVAAASSPKYTSSGVRYSRD
jgi:hypothetical protein